MTKQIHLHHSHSTDQHNAHTTPALGRIKCRKSHKDLTKSNLFTAQDLLHCLQTPSCLTTSLSSNSSSFFSHSKAYKSNFRSVKVSIKPLWAGFEIFPTLLPHTTTHGFEPLIRILFFHLLIKHEINFWNISIPLHLIHK